MSTSVEPDPREGAPFGDLHVLTLALESMERDLDGATDVAEHRELTEQIRLLTARIDRLLGVRPSGVRRAHDPPR